MKRQVNPKHQRDKCREDKVFLFFWRNSNSGAFDPASRCTPAVADELED